MTAVTTAAPRTDTFLRRVLLLDAILTGASALMWVGLTGFLHDLTGLPEGLLRGAGLVLLPYVAFLAYIATRPEVPRKGAWAAVIINALWTVDSVIVLVAGWAGDLNALGVGYVLFIAAVVLGFAELQYIGLRKARR
ncbi:hypothetical protein [Bailinhaonella thermotolerans]|uniref:DUF2568 domain-containing protein n=1 Tax=Bailinhaonella thermotolerans TaxID=1070861 RepID=A0A3A4B533_9ACTN|nr:hypothetical protein [Bailinhaonella thermotolerans]RJL33181.1 hypothetical protein D5H75_10070 [Bailinhaonella thermotolerans]